MPAFGTAEQQRYPKHTQNYTTSMQTSIIIAHTNKVHVNRNGQLNITVILHTHADMSWPSNTSPRTLVLMALL